MTHTTTAAPLSGDPRTGPAVTRNLDALLAAVWDCQPATAHAIRFRGRSPLLRVIDEFRARVALHGEGNALGWIEPLLQEINAVQAVPDLRVLDHLEQSADIAEDAAQEAWRHDPSVATARALLAKSAEHRHIAERRDAALRASLEGPCAA